MKHGAKGLLYAALIAASFFSVNCAKEKEADPKYVKEIQQWQQKRAENLKKPTGWLTLIGLFWLKEGENTFGSAKDNDFVFPEGKAAAHMGAFILKDSVVSIKINSGVKVLINKEEKKEAVLRSDMEEETDILNYGSLQWNIIKRGQKYGVRLRDLESDKIKNFAGIETFPVKESWKVIAKYTPYNPPKKIEIPTVLGTVEEGEAPGYLSFAIDGKEYKLDPTQEGDEFFIIFADMTNGEDTYGAGRFLYSAAADSTGYVTLDFNKAYNPPCAFSRYATCPLPPEQNRLHVRVEAGEKAYKGEH
jgi:uncharacterized protein (DUF1684 family)